VIAVDVNPGRIEAARQRALALGSPVELRVMDSEKLDFPDDTFDSAVATLVFCSVPNPVQGLRELGRVVKPGGDIRLVEHVRIDRPVIGRLMDWLDPVMMLLGGEHLNRRTVANVIRSGLQLVSVEDLTRGGLVKLIVARSPCRLTESGSKYQEGAGNAV
jgi:ubiquinone/menaquinone biosynthesis C-methylase UbiE